MAPVWSVNNPPPKRCRAAKKAISWPKIVSRNSWTAAAREFGYRPALAMLASALCDDLPIRKDACQHCSGPFRGDEVPVTILRGAWCHPHCASLFMRPFVDRARVLLDRYLAKSLKDNDKEIA